MSRDPKLSPKVTKAQSLQRMNIKSVLTLVLFLPLCSSFTESHLFNFVISSMKQKHRTKSVSVHTIDPHKLTSSPGRFIQRLIMEFPTMVYNPTVLSNFTNARRLLRSRIPRKSMHVIISDNEGSLRDYISYLVNYLPRMARPKCLVLVFNSRGKLDLRKFFEFAWSHRFLELIVLEMSENWMVVVHDYNPFSGAYHRRFLHGGLVINKSFVI